MDDPTIAGLPLTTDDKVEIDGSLLALVEAQKSDLIELGCTPTSVHVSAGGVPPRFFFTFPPGLLSYQIRHLLASKGFEVGQQMGDKMLRFYASKRVEQGKGWQV
jgi:hypothetical protein